MAKTELETKKVTKAEKKSSVSSTTKSLLQAPSPRGYLAATRIRGDRKIDVHVKDTLIKLNMTNQHRLVILPHTPVYEGMMKMAKDYITYGEVSEAFAKQVDAKLTKVLGNGKIQKYYSLHPPRGGYERKGIKTGYGYGGALGYRGDKMAALITKMMPVNKEL